MPRKLPRTAPSSDVRTSTRDATTSIQQEENKDAPEWNIYLPRSGITWTFGGFLGLNKDKIDQLECEWNNDGRGALGTGTGADNTTEADHEPAEAPEEENLQHEDVFRSWVPVRLHHRTRLYLRHKMQDRILPEAAT